ncbi:hypothetical protein GAY31_19515 [Azospirillum brasilense]|nr:hypothetical protein [Azospirillum brasilense]
MTDGNPAIPTIPTFDTLPDDVKAAGRRFVGADRAADGDTHVEGHIAHDGTIYITRQMRSIRGGKRD